MNLHDSHPSDPSEVPRSSSSKILGVWNPHHHTTAQSIERLQLIISKSLELPPDVMTSDDRTVTFPGGHQEWSRVLSVMIRDWIFNSPQATDRRFTKTKRTFGKGSLQGLRLVLTTQYLGTLTVVDCIDESAKFCGTKFYVPNHHCCCCCCWCCCCCCCCCCCSCCSCSIDFFVPAFS